MVAKIWGDGQQMKQQQQNNNNELQNKIYITTQISEIQQDISKLTLVTSDWKKQLESETKSKVSENKNEPETKSKVAEKAALKNTDLQLKQQIQQIPQQEQEKQITQQQELIDLQQKLTKLQQKLTNLKKQLQDYSQVEKVNNLQKQIDQIQQIVDDPGFLIQLRQTALEKTYIKSDPTLSDELYSSTNFYTIKGNETYSYIPQYELDKGGIMQQQSYQNRGAFVTYKNSLPSSTFSGQDITPDEKSLVPIQIIPFPNGKIITQNTFTISTPFYNDNDTYKEYNFLGDYKITSSSNNNYAYKAFTYDGTWKSVNTYNITDYTSSYYIGSQETKVKQETILLRGASKNYGTTNVKGEWLQISLPSDKPFYLFRCSIRVPSPVFLTASYPNSRTNDSTYIYPQPLPPNAKYTSLFPKSFTVVGSNDGINWYNVDQQTFIEPPDLILSNSDSTRASLNIIKGFNKNNNSYNFELNSVIRYTFYRLIITELFPGNNNVSIGTWGLYGFVQNIPPNIKTLEPFSNLYVTGMSSNFGQGSKSPTANLIGGFQSPDKYGQGSKSPTTNLIGGEQLTSTFGDDFSKGIDSKLKNTYIEQLTNLNEARNIPNPLSNLASYSIIENFDSHGFVQYSGGSTNSNAVINNQINPTISIYSDFLSKQTQINNNVYDLSQNIYDFSNNYFKTLKDPNDKYDMSGNNFNKPPTHLDGLISDNKEIIMQQNNIFILSTITITTLVLALILVSK